MEKYLIEIVAVASLALLAQFAVFLRWVYRRTTAAKIERVFIRDIAANHLPHIYSVLRQIATKLEIDLEEPPPVRFIDLGKNGR